MAYGFANIVVAALLLIASVIDVQKRIVPHALLLVLVAVWLVSGIYSSKVLPCVDVGKRMFIHVQYCSVPDVFTAFLEALLLCLCLVAFEIAFYKFFGKHGLGGGDIKLLSVLTLFVGALHIVTMLGLACIFLLIVAFGRSVFTRKFSSITLNSTHPFVPYICASFLVLSFL